MLTREEAGPQQRTERNKMTKKQAIQLFEERKVRTAWDSDAEKWYFSVVDVVSVLTASDYQTARKYWKVLKGRLIKEGNELVTNCYQLKLLAPDGKMRLTDNARSLIGTETLEIEDNNN